MILYKYLSPEDGAAFLENPLLNFTPPKYFNDPFEVTSTYSVPTESKHVQARKIYNDEIYRTHYHILSLTRSPLNKLMWAHYAKDHKGYVVGIDVDQSFFTSRSTCSVPAQFGSVIYTQSKPDSSLLTATASSGCRYDFPTYEFENAELLQRLFLYKSIDWAYEEEVRIVKMLGNIGLHRGDNDPLNIERKEHFQITMEKESTRFRLRIPRQSIKEVYLGVGNDLSEIDKINAEYHDTHKFICTTDLFSWELKAKSL